VLNVASGGFFIVTTCLVTGGAGFIGSHLTEALLSRGHSVRVLDDLSTGNSANLAAVADRIEFFQGSVIHPDVVKRAVAGSDVVYHLAALPSVAKSVEEPLTVHDICATGTLQVLDAARRAKVRRVVYAASSSAYGDQPGDVRRETDLLLPLSPYAAAKLAGEHYCQCATAVYGLETVRLRFFNVFGPRQDARSPYSGVISLFSAAMSQGKAPTVFGDGLQTRDFVYVANVVQALLKAAEAPAAVGNVYNIGMGQRVTILDLVQHLNSLLGVALKPIHAGPRAGDVRHSLADIALARRDLGYEPTVSFREGLQRTLKSHQL
jgi:nucleoside-diphosphate-sugar epimerase